MEQCEVKKINPNCYDRATEEILCSLEKTQGEFWNLDRESANFLSLLIEMNNSKNVLEIGTSNGYSGIWILKALEKTNGKMTTIEFWEKRQSTARKNFAICAPNVEAEAKIGRALIVLEDLKDEISKGKREKFDFVFVDANKREYPDYFKFIDEMLEGGGVIVADNILTHYEKTLPYVNMLFENENYRSQILELGAGMMISRKN